MHVNRCRAVSCKANFVFLVQAAANDAVKVLTTMKKYHNTPTTAKVLQFGSSNF